MRSFSPTISHFAAAAMLVCLCSSTINASPGVVQKGDVRAEVASAFGGVVEDRALLNTDLPSAITDEKNLKLLWKTWKLGKMPTVDFATQFVTVATWGGSRMEMVRTLDEEGNLTVACGGGTKDKIAGFTYLIEVYSHTGIRTVNGQKLPEPKAKKPTIPAIEELLVKPLELALKEADLTNYFFAKHVIVNDLDEAKKYFEGDDLKKVSGTQFEFGRQVILILCWSGSGRDKMTYEAAETHPEQVTLWLQGGETKDLVRHTKVYRLRADVKWELAPQLPPLVELPVEPIPKVFDGAGRASPKNPLIIRTLDEAKKYFGEKDLKKVSETNFRHQNVLVFTWKGGGEMKWELAPDFPQQVTFRFQPGQANGVAERTQVYRLRSNVKWKRGADLGREEVGER